MQKGPKKMILDESLPDTPIKGKNFRLHSDFFPSGDQPTAIAELVSGLHNDVVHQTLLGVTGSGKTFTIAHVIQTVQRTTLVLAPNKTLAAQLYGEMKGFFPENAVEYFVSYYDYYQPEAYIPSSDTYIQKDASLNELIEQMRLSATKALIERRDAIVVATVSAIYGLGEPASYFSLVLHLVRGDLIEQRTLLRRLTELQYTRNDTELRRARYRVRGEVIDVYPAESEKEALRIELFDNEIVQLSLFDPITGECISKIVRYTVYPTNHYVTPREKIEEAVKHIQDELQHRLEALASENRPMEAQRLEQRTRFDLEMLLEIGYCQGIENYSRFLSGRNPGEPPPTLFDYLPSDALLIVDESHVTLPQLSAMYRADASRKEVLVRYGFRLPSALDNRPLRFEEFEARSPQRIYVSATPGGYERRHSKQIVEQIVRPTGLVDPEVEIRPASRQVEDLLSEIRLRCAQNERVLVTTLTKRMAEDITDYLFEQDIAVRYLHSDIDTIERVEIIRDLRLGKCDVIVGINLLREGLDIPEVSLVAVFDADKEGFLRSTVSLIQTIGRAARHLHGKAILYADVVTGSIQSAMEETERRRQKQTEYNKMKGLVPKSIHKEIKDILELPSSGTFPSKRKKSSGKKSFLPVDHETMSPLAITQLIRKLEEKMYVAARNLHFEEAAELRDTIHHLQNSLFVSSPN